METVYKDSMCRCCASEGSFKDFTASYEWMGVEEVYADMLKDCFDITLSSPVPGNSNGGICEVCVTQLRNAFNFKKQVQNTEERFKKMQEVVFKPETIKIEIPNDDMDINSDNLDDDFSGPDYEVPIKFESSEEKPKKRTRASTSAARAKRAKPDGETSSKREQGDVNEWDGLYTINIVKTEPDKVKCSLNEEMNKHWHNIREILKCSNATPIRSFGGRGYLCCYCTEQFVEPADLKLHTLQSHEGIDDACFTTKAHLNGYCIKLDITDLHCSICEESIDDLDILIYHLIEEHEISIFTDIKNLIVPFKFDTDELQCYVCLEKFGAFKVLLAHMNVHIRNYVCDLCDAGFVNIKQLRGHEGSHKTGVFKCNQCDKVFNTMRTCTFHMNRAHNRNGRFVNKCNYCTATFKECRQKQKHQLEVHGVGTMMKCEECDRSFSSQTAYRVHVNRDHLKERKFACTMCEMRFFKCSDLYDHMVKHTGTRTFKCEVCQKAFARRKTLREHMRIHTNDRRFKCEICGQAYVQKCNLRSHMRSKHGEELY